ncbi:MAG TPA: hypothetical protein VE866_00995 [Candidatus Binatia bacterium]|nr:hypothetical protein [Candidatus Binatia bacterium]
MDRNRGRSTVREYYFSAGADGQIRKLTRRNLQQSFPDNHRFQDSLKVTIKAEHNLADYDKFHKMFKINRLLTASHDPDL